MQHQHCAITLNSVSYRYSGQDRNALTDITLSIPRGQCVVITGRSGCGKTTLTRLINGLAQHVYEGEITGDAIVCGKRVDSWEVSELGKTVGSVFQNPRSQFVNQDVVSEVAFGCENLGLPREVIRERVFEAANSVGVVPLLAEAVDTLSGGQKQAVIVASAYAMQPDVFVLDEPTASLDTEAMIQLGRTIARLKALGKTIVVSEHRLWWLASCADRVVLMEDGRIAQDWTATEYAAIPVSKRRARGMRAWTLDEMTQAEEVTCDREPSLLAASNPAQRIRADNACETTCSCTSNNTYSASACKNESVTAPVLAIEGLSVAYSRRQPVLKDVNLTLASESVCGLIGRNGAGKTTLLRCLSGLTREQQGHVHLHGQPLPYKRRCGRIHLVMQDPGYQLFATSVREELERAYTQGQTYKHTRAPYKGGTDHEPNDASSLHNAVGDVDAPDSAVNSALEQFGLTALAHRHPLSLSGGERQRLAIAAGVLQHADVIVLDEPTSGLDFDNMNRVAHELRNLALAGCAVVLVSHDYEFLCAACSDIAELENGSISAQYPLDVQSHKHVEQRFGFTNTP